MKTSKQWMLVLGGVVGAAGWALAAKEAAYEPVIEPTNFVQKVDNPCCPLLPGTTQRYRALTEDGVEEITVTVTPETKAIIGVTCIVVHDVAMLKGKVHEDTLDWYAQDRDGNVWYFGEDTKAYEHGGTNTEGSWQAGVNGAKPGIVMPGHPKVGDVNRQEYLPGTAEDMTEILEVDATVKIAAGTYTNCVRTKDWSPLEPAVVENKYFAPGVGMVLSKMVHGGSEREELVGP